MKRKNIDRAQIKKPGQHKNKPKSKVRRRLLKNQDILSSLKSKADDKSK